MRTRAGSNVETELRINVVWFRSLKYQTCSNILYIEKFYFTMELRQTRAHKISIIKPSTQTRVFAAEDKINRADSVIRSKQTNEQL